RGRTARRRTTRALLVAPRTDHLRSSLRTTRRRSPDPRLLRPNDPLPPRPKRRPQTQPRTTHDSRHTQTLTPRHDRLHRPTPPRRQDTTRSQPLPQALPRPQPLPATRTRTARDDLTNIEAALAQVTVGSLERHAIGTGSRASTVARRCLGATVLGDCRCWG